MHFSASDSSVKMMMMDLISSANDFCIVFGICDHLGKINEIDFESRRNKASVVLAPRVSETCHSVSTLCNWQFLKLCFDIGG